MKPGIRPQQKGQQLLGFVRTEGHQAQLRIISLLAPLGAILGPVVHQHQDLGRSDAFNERIQKPLRLTVDLMQIFNYEQHRLVETLSQQQLLERFKRPLPANLRIHLLQR